MDLILGINNNLNFELYNINKLKKAAKNNQILKEENENLKDRLYLIEKKLEELKNNFENYTNMMNLNCLYNSFDITAFKLENIFNNLKNGIIKQREELWLINKGIKKLFNKNIENFICKYKSQNDEIDVSEFQKNLDNLTYSIIIVVTKDNKSFGSFYKKEKDIHLQMNNFQQNNIQNIQNIQNFQNINRQYNLFNNINQNNNNSINQQNENNNCMNNNVDSNRNTQTINQNMNINTIFNSSLSSKEYFVFSLNNLMIYYSTIDTTGEINNIPCFSILFDNNRQCLYGKETQIRNISSSYAFHILSGKNEFNIKYFELYEVIIRN